MVNHKQRHYDRRKGWQDIKARKMEVLKFIEDKEIVTARDLKNEFDYTYNSARCRLSQLHREGYIEPFWTLSRGQWTLSPKGVRKIDYLQSSKEKEAEEKHKREIEVESLQQRLEELESRLSEVHKTSVRLSEEILPTLMTAVFLVTHDPKSGLGYFKATVVNLQAELQALIKQSAA